MSKIIVSKVDAAKRQIETAIFLWFQSGDIVSIETLTGAAYQVVFDLSKQVGIDSPPCNLLVTKQERKDFSDLRKKSKNFLSTLIWMQGLRMSFLRTSRSFTCITL